MNQVTIRICYGKELYSEVKSEMNIAPGDVPKVAEYLAYKLSIRAGETAAHAKKRAGGRRAKETRRNKSNIIVAGEMRAQSG